MLTDQQHPITPPSPELVERWIKEPGGCNAVRFATQAARWGADQELEACSEWLLNSAPWTVDPNERPEWVQTLKRCRRPKPPSLAENVSKALDRLPGPGADASYLRIWADKEAYGLRCAVRRALERLQELEEGNE